MQKPSAQTEEHAHVLAGQLTVQMYGSAALIDNLNDYTREELQDRREAAHMPQIAERPRGSPEPPIMLPRNCSKHGQFHSASP